MVTFMRVRRIMKSDLPEIRKLLQGIRNKESIYADVASSCFYEDSAYQGFVLICFHSIVGIAVLWYVPQEFNLPKGITIDTKNSNVFHT